MKFILFLALTVFSSIGFSSGRRDLLRSFRFVPSFSQKVPRYLTPGTFPQLIDHSVSSDGATFSQRFWIDSEYATSPEAPVLLRICGEASGEDFLDDMTPAFAKQLGAHIVYLEHRYYGESLPFADISAEHLQYLTLNNVIEDIAFFQKWLATHRHINGKWITLGGSYSGTISAIYRQMHPELVVGALAASAPMQSLPSHETDSGMDEMTSTNPQDYGDSGDRQWAYQACRDFGFWMMMSGPYFLEPSAELCSGLFNITQRADKAAFNAAHYFPFITNSPTAPTHVLFTNGSEDGWAQISIAENANHNPGITVRMIEGAGHHYDLNPGNDSAEIEAARSLFLQLARSWLQ
jgi:pimeloyl-ACP methyl ester carboxylesterase